MVSALFAAIKSTQEGVGRLPHKPEREDLVRDPLDLKLDDFIREIPKAIRECRFVVHDVTHLTPGVAFEIGLAVGYRKVEKLVWDNARRNFDVAELPFWFNASSM